MIAVLDQVKPLPPSFPPSFCNNKLEMFPFSPSVFRSVTEPETSSSTIQVSVQSSLFSLPEFGLSLMSLWLPKKSLPEGYDQVRPIPVCIEANEENFVATTSYSSMFGVGSTRKEALFDLYGFVCSSFLSLLDNDGALGDDLQSELDFLKEVFRRRSISAQK